MLAAAKEKFKGSPCHYSLLDSKNTSGLAPLPFPLFALDLSDCKLQAGPRVCCSPYRPQFVPYGIQCKAAAATSKHAVPGTEPGRVMAAAPGGGAKPPRMGHWGQRPPPCPTHTDTDMGSSPGFQPGRAVAPWFCLEEGRQPRGWQVNRAAQQPGTVELPVLMDLSAIDWCHGAQSTATPVGLGGGGTPGTRSFNESRRPGRRGWGTGTAGLAALTGNCACQVLPVSAALSVPPENKAALSQRSTVRGKQLGPLLHPCQQRLASQGCVSCGLRTHRWHPQCSGASAQLGQHRQQHGALLAPGSWHRAQELGPRQGVGLQSLQPCPFSGVPLCQIPGLGA